MGGLIASKRFEFAASHYYRNAAWDSSKNEAVFGKDALGVHGHGHNFIMYAGFEGPLDPDTGMIVELSHVKRDVLADVLPRYDHYVLNDVPAFQKKLPTPENMAAVLLSDIQTVFSGRSYRPHHVHLIESPVSAATAYADGRIERHWQQPLGNASFFGFWGSGEVTLGLSLAGQLDTQTGMIVSDMAVYQNLSDVAAHILGLSLPNRDTSAVDSMMDVLGNSVLIYDRAVIKTPKGVFSFCTQSKSSEGLLRSVTGSYTATHRLDNPRLSLSENESCFGKCHRPHGHTFDVEISVVSDQSLSDIETCLHRILSEWDYQSLETHPDFEGRLCTTEHMVQVLADKWEKRGMGTLKRMRLHETPNNRFSLRLW
jgi:6-pyruvoyltetrahydropterin/6-carboxytetrahydropterin synthase